MSASHARSRQLALESQDLPLKGEFRAAPANIAGNKVGNLELWCDGTAETDVMVRWTVQP